MRRKARKKVRKSILLSLLCLLIILPNSAFANLATTDDTSTPVLENTEQVEVDATQPEVEPTPEPTGEATTVTEPETVVEPEAPVVTEPTDPVVEPTDPAVEPTEPVDTPAVPETEQVVPVTPPAAQAQVAAPAALEDEEETWPEIGDVTFSPRDAKVGDMVTVTVKMLDGNAIEETVEEVTALIHAPNQDWNFNDGQIVRLRYDADDNQWVGFFIVQETWNPGYWEAEIHAEYSWEVYNDYPGDQDYKEYSGLEKDIQFAFNVLNKGDSTPPQGIEITASPNPVRAGQPVTFAATLKDVNNQSDIVYALLELDYNRRGYEVLASYEEMLNIPLTFDATSGKWVGTYYVPGNVPDGTIIDYYVLIADSAGNITGQYFYDEEQYLLVENPDGDVTPPELRRVAAPDPGDVLRVNVKKGTVTIPIKAKVVDHESGVKSVTAEVRYAGTPTVAAASKAVWDDYWKYYTTELTFNSETGRYEGSVDLTVDDPAGFYDVYITAEDNNGNIDTNYGTYFELVNPDTDWYAPQILDFDVIGDPVKFGDIMKINAKVTDEVPDSYSSGIHSVMAEIYYDSTDEWDEIELILNPVTGRYETDYSIKHNDVFVVVYVYAIDNSGNYAESNEEFVEIYNLDDYLPPYIDFVKYPPATMYQGEVAHFETRLVDEGTGIHSATITLINVLDVINNPFGDSDLDVSVTLPLTFNPAKGVWETDWLIPTDSPTGLFLVNLTVFDNVGNRSDVVNYGGYAIPQTFVILPKPVVSGGGTVTPTPVSNPVTQTVTTVSTSTVTPVTTSTKTATELPDTATNNFNLLFAGLALVVIGGTRLVFRRRVGK